jgi:hypothetical protein
MDAGGKLTDTDAVEFNQIPEICKSQQIWKPQRFKEKSCKVVGELSIVEEQSHTASPTHERRQIQSPQHQQITSLPPSPHLQTPDLPLENS